MKNNSAVWSHRPKKSLLCDWKCNSVSGVECKCTHFWIKYHHSGNLAEHICSQFIPAQPMWFLREMHSKLYHSSRNTPVIRLVPRMHLVKSWCIDAINNAIPDWSPTSECPFLTTSPSVPLPLQKSIAPLETHYFFFTSPKQGSDILAISLVCISSAIASSPLPTSPPHRHPHTWRVEQQNMLLTKQFQVSCTSTQQCEQKCSAPSCSQANIKYISSTIK